MKVYFCLFSITFFPVSSKVWGFLQVSWSKSKQTPTKSIDNVLADCIFYRLFSSNINKICSLPRGDQTLCCCRCLFYCTGSLEQQSPAGQCLVLSTYFWRRRPSWPADTLQRCASHTTGGCRHSTCKTRWQHEALSWSVCFRVSSPRVGTSAFNRQKSGLFWATCPSNSKWKSKYSLYMEVVTVSDHTKAQRADINLSRTSWVCPGGLHQVRQAWNPSPRRFSSQVTSDVSLRKEKKGFGSRGIKPPGLPPWTLPGPQTTSPPQPDLLSDRAKEPQSGLFLWPGSSTHPGEGNSLFSSSSLVVRAVSPKPDAQALTLKQAG